MRQMSDGVNRSAEERLPESTLLPYAAIAQSRHEEGLAAYPHVSVPAAEWGTSVAKRSLDVVVSALLLLVSAPLWPIIAALIKLESPGPVFIRQSRAGRFEQPFRLLKFRSMREAAAPHNSMGTSQTRKERSAHRTTKLGRLLRRSSLDELPQLVNVFLGDMSLIGPRPLVFGDVHDPYQIAPTSSEIGASALRHWRQVRSLVRPGMTGLWQVNGRSTLPLEGWLHYDVAYVEQCSLKLDLEVVRRTVAVVLKGIGAV